MRYDVAVIMPTTDILKLKGIAQKLYLSGSRKDDSRGQCI
jgi:hypothetical protein